jgi:hypothetical protein
MVRKQAETDRLRQRIASLETAVESMSNEFIEFGSRLVDFSRDSWHPQMLDDLKETTGRFLVYARKAESLANGEEGGSMTVSENLPVSELSTISTAFTSPSSCLLAVMGHPTSFEYGALSSFPETQLVALVTLPPPRASHFSPRLGYGLLSQSAPQLRAAEALPTHYFVAGPNSFAMHLYKDSIMLSIRTLRGEISIPGFIPSMFRYRSRYEIFGDFVSNASVFLQKLSLEDSTIEDVAAGRSAFENESSIVLFGPSHPVMTSPLRAKIQHDMMQEIGSLSEWLDPWNTQRYLQKQWGFVLTASTARLVIEKLARQNPPEEVPDYFVHDPYLSHVEPWYGSTQEAQEAMGRDESWFVPPKNVPEEPNPVLPSQALADKLIESAVCFGEGPRFFKGNIDATASEFLTRMNDRRQESGIFFQG